LVLSWRLKDVYRREDVGTTSYTLQFIVGSTQKTLTADEITKTWEQIVTHAKVNNFIIDNT